MAVEGEADRACPPPGPSPAARCKPDGAPAALEAGDTSRGSSDARPATRSRAYLAYLLGFTITLSTLTATAYFPLIPLLAARFGASVQAVNLTVTAYAGAQALAPAPAAALADSARVGRRPVLLALVALHAAASLGLAVNAAGRGRGSYAALLALRVLQSVGGSPTPAVAYGIVADVAAPAERGAMLGLMLSTCNALSAVGPVVGGAVALATAGVWRTWWDWLRVLGAAVAGLDGGDAGVEKKVKGEGEGSKTPFSPPRPSPGPNDGSSPSSSNVRSAGWMKRTLGGAFASFRIILHKDAFAVLWVVASSYSVYYTFQVAIPVIFDEVYGYNELEIGLVFLPGLGGMTIGGIVAGKLVDRNYAVTARRHGFEIERRGDHSLADFPIEAARYRHCLVFVAAQMALVIGYGWAVWFRVHPSVPIVLQFWVCVMSTLLSHTASALLVDIFSNCSSSAYALGQLMRCGLSAASAAVLQPLVDAVGRGWYFTIFSLLVSLTGAASVLVSQTMGMQWRRKRVSWESQGSQS